MIAASIVPARTALSRYSPSTAWLLWRKRLDDGSTASLTSKPNTATYTTTVTPKTMIDVRSEPRLRGVVVMAGGPDRSFAAIHCAVD